MKKLFLLILGIAFALAFSSCDDQESKKGQLVHQQKQLVDKEKHHHKRW